MEIRKKKSLFFGFTINFAEELRLRVHPLPSRDVLLKFLEIFVIMVILVALKIAPFSIEKCVLNQLIDFLSPIFDKFD